MRHFAWAVVWLAASTAVADEGAFAPLFDGKSLAGWEGDLKMFRVEDGAIVAGIARAADPPQRVPVRERGVRRF